MADVADHESLAAPVRHDLGPRWLGRDRGGEVGQLADLVHLDGVRAGADLASALEQSTDQLLVGVERSVRLTIDKSRRLLPFGRNPAEPGDQWVPALTHDSPGPPSRRRQIAAVRMAISTVSWMYDSGRWPYLVTYPFLHLPLVDFCLGVPTEQFIRPGQTRSLHRRALRDQLPPEIVARRDKRGPDEAIQRSLASSWPRIQAWLGDPEVVRRGWVNNNAFRRMIDLARFGRQRTELVFILRTIALEAWLRRQSG